MNGESRAANDSTTEQNSVQQCGLLILTIASPDQPCKLTIRSMKFDCDPYTMFVTHSARSFVMNLCRCRMELHDACSNNVCIPSTPDRHVAIEYSPQLPQLAPGVTSPCSCQHDTIPTHTVWFICRSLAVLPCTWTVCAAVAPGRSSQYYSYSYALARENKTCCYKSDVCCVRMACL
jgi:hypothetical protein